MNKKDLKSAGAERRKQILQSGADLREKVADTQDKKKDTKRSRREWKQNKEF